MEMGLKNSSAEDPGDEREELDELGRPLYSEDGVDLTLIRWMLSLTPLERLRVLQRQVDSLTRMRAARGRSGA